VVTPEGVEDRFSEKIWRFPVTRFCYTPPHEDIPIRDAPFQNNGHITFGSFNKLSKLTDEVVAVWSEILAHVPEAKLMLKSRQLEDPEIRLTTQARFSQHGIPPKRLILEGVTNRNDYLEAFNRIDIALDPFPFPGGTTSADAIWMGVPVLTRKGENLISRQGEGILTSAKLTEWIATDNENYVRKAVAFATDLERLVELKKELRKRDESRPLYDADQFARDFEVLVRSIWKDYCKEKGVAIADSPVLDFSKWT
jgi:predicted O-linked N-acetylglucosamine transferase (SPINDLY family)